MQQSDQLPMAVDKNTDVLEYDLVVYHLLAGSSFPTQVAGLGKIRMERIAVDAPEWRRQRHQPFQFRPSLSR
jgi:hypothetical protein